VQLYGCVFNLPHTVTRSVLLDSAPAEVWEALTDETALSEWLAPEVELEPREGGRVLCRYEDGSERRGEVELVVVIETAGRRADLWSSSPHTGPSTAVGGGWAPRLGALRAVVGRLVLA
jgi:hypothetical protein